MNIIIIGAGEVGLHLAKNLSWEGHDITIVDNDQSKVDRAGGNLDVLALCGSGTSVSMLEKAGVKEADLLIAATYIDEINIVACMLAKQLGHSSQIHVARVRSLEYSSPDVPFSLTEFGIDQVINPELEAAREVVRMIQYQHATDIVECATGKMLLLGIRVEPNAPIIGPPLKKLMPEYPNLSFRLVAIFRSGKTIIPTGDNAVRQGDTIYAMAPSNETEPLFRLAGKPSDATSSKDVMLLGGGRIGRYVAKELEEKNFNIKLIENDEERSELAADQLMNTIVVRSREGIDIDLLAMEGLSQMGVFAALTDDDESNIVTSLFARQMKIKRTITLVSRSEYMTILRAIGLDTAINERILTSDAIIKYLLGGRIMAVSSLQAIDAEIVEFEVDKWSKAEDKRIKEIDFPSGSIVGAIEHRGEVNVAVGNSFVKAGDRVVVFCHQRVIHKLEKIFKK
ncbi:MAG: Trk system potassium transporter TrkA [Candidatus Electryoneaceae bacterium]|nr:Trk system potassium transporter TrkA [Candidatus Electryoneaceae bacterium]